MDLYEHQARDLFAAHGVPVPPGELATDPAQARAAADRLGSAVMVKAQVKTGGRGKAGGVRHAAGPEAAEAAAADILGMDIKGHTVHSVLVTPASEIADEYYAAVLLDRATRGFLALASAQGGMEIEQIAAERPEALARVPIDPARGIDGPTAREIVRQAGFPAGSAEAVAEVFRALWQVAAAEDALLVEVNPLVRDGDGRILALDGKVTLDDNAEFRHPGRSRFAAGAADGSAAGAAAAGGGDPLEARARAKGLNYVRLDSGGAGVGIIGNGAGLVMSTLDVVAQAGERHGGAAPADFLDIGGGASAEVMADGLEVVLADPAVRSVLVNVFGGITACDAVAEGIVRAYALLAERGEPVDRPVVVRLDGNNAELGRRILTEAGLPGVQQLETMDSAAERAGELAAAGG
ncbi:ADP-forming succinate--CoA ligase subunit beta [Phaeacidiphilus oryzae]|uniref:ADP-forming succinate--CoA ligase subunit beta n=1 Tax=Phaeacidiphilus oryzae TaxID=348818 RepID=UPI0005615401|nr:ADP-forming succinate--CoA ligase subunit beta [Phaeacidiphilus oryzae]